MNKVINITKPITSKLSARNDLKALELCYQRVIRDKEESDVKVK